MKLPRYLLLLACLYGQSLTAADDPFEREPIAYSTTLPQDAVTIVQAKLASGALNLAGDEKQVVRKLLAALHVPTASQLLVFSRTSFQKDRIDPAHPRAIYFSDEVYVGWCPGGLVEIAAIDPVLGPVFYSFDPKAGQTTNRFQRDPDCLRCHGGTFVREIPGLLARSVFTAGSGQPMLALGSDLVDGSTPLEKRWGGWYVTALRAGPRHRGNLVLSKEQEPDAAQMEQFANLRSLEKLVDTSPYLERTSDIAALLVFEHQVGVQNALTRANQECLRMMAYQKNLQRELHEPVTEDPTYESVRHVFTEASQKVLDALLSREEAPLPKGGIQGVGEFAKIFGEDASRAVSLKQLDLKERLFQYRCSYLIESSTFTRLEPALRRRVLRRLWRVLTDPRSEPRYDYLETSERDAIRSLVAVKVSQLPATWRTAN